MLFHFMYIRHDSVDQSALFCFDQHSDGSCECQAEKFCCFSCGIIIDNYQMITGMLLCKNHDFDFSVMKFCPVHTSVDGITDRISANPVVFQDLLLHSVIFYSNLLKNSFRDVYLPIEFFQFRMNRQSAFERAIRGVELTITLGIGHIL